MKQDLRVVSVVLMTIGPLWFLQGMGVLPGNFMTDQTRWAVNCGLTAATGLVLLAVTRTELVL